MASNSLVQPPKASSAQQCVASADPIGTLLVFSDDRGRHPSSCQHLMRQLPDRQQEPYPELLAMNRCHCPGLMPNEQLDARPALETENWNAKATQLEAWILEGLEVQQ